MPSIESSPHFTTGFNAQPGTKVQVAPQIQRITAPNANAYTYTGTNSYLVGETEIFLIDPGPDDASHHKALLRALEGRLVTAILLTHTHKDHCALAGKLADTLNAPLWFGGKHRLSRPKRLFEVNKLHAACDWKLTPDRTLADNETIRAGTVELRVIATPGHCANHLCFGVLGTPYLFSGDHVMGWNSTLVATPDGSMDDYFNSLDRLIRTPWTHYFPGHGDAISATGEGKADGRRFTEALRKHRQLRNHQILVAIKSGASRISEIVDLLYPHVSFKIRIAARMTVVAHVELLADQGKLRLEHNLFGRMRVSIQDKDQGQGPR